MASNAHVEKLQKLLETIFQFDSADLDFGIYRIMNYKRDAIKKFIQKDLIEAISAELQKGVLSVQSQAIKELDTVRKQVLDILGKSAIESDGSLSGKFKNTKIGKRFLSLKEKTSAAKDSSAVEVLIFNYLFTFFNRYYDNGDFLSKRRYSKKEKYAIPYNGEEVHLHWANNDQYYIKTSENFTDYSYTKSGITVRFKLRNAENDNNNIKGDKRFFIPLAKESLYDSKTKEVIIPFEHRILSENEIISYGKRNQQEALISEAHDILLEQLNKNSTVQSALFAEKRKDSKNNSISHVVHHIRRYATSNTSDFFIHKNLKSYLENELVHYLKNEVLNLDDIEAAGEGLCEGWFQILKIVRNVGIKIIDFLAQIENYQKNLYDKIKFITEHRYLITVAHIPNEFYSDIADNDEQWSEWRDLFHINEEAKNLFTSNDRLNRRIDYLKNNPTLIIDTKYYSNDFINSLIACYEDIDDKIDGLLVESENYQALKLLLNKYKNKVKSVYIDPPYNTSENTFLYKNNYKHSSWITMMQSRLNLAYSFLLKNGVLSCAIDDNEKHHLRMILQNIFGMNNYVTTISAEVNPAGQNLRPNAPALSHDYCMVFAKEIDRLGMLLRGLTKEEEAQYTERDDKGKFLWDNLRRRGGNSRPSDRPKQWFPLYADLKSKKVSVDKFKGSEEIWPIDPKAEKRIWRVNPEGARREIAAKEISVLEKAGRTEIVKKTRMPEGKKPKTFWGDSKYSATTHGTKLLIDLLGKQIFSYPKSVYLVEDCIRYWASQDDIVLDFFAGSGTTGHAVINLNREDDNNRKFILVEMGQYFNDVVVNRIKKVVYAPEWRMGKPKRLASREEAVRSPRIIKYIRLESYEDALNNITLTLPKGQKTIQFDDYLMKYMLEWETRESDTLLNIEKLASPFSYELVLTEGQETKKKLVDLPETFNYILGLHVKTREVYKSGKENYLVYRGIADNRETVVIWREIKDWKKKDYERDKEFIKKEKIAVDADDIFVNGDSLIPKARSLDPVFKSRMFGGV